MINNDCVLHCNYESVLCIFGTPCLYVLFCIVSCFICCFYLVFVCYFVYLFITVKVVRIVTTGHQLDEQ